MPTDPPSTETPTGVIGDPYFQRKDGTLVKFVGVSGSWYSLASDSSVKVAFRIASIPNAMATDTMVDAVSIKVPGHTVAVGLTSCVVDGKAQAPGLNQTIFNGSIKWHTGAAGEPRVDVAYGSWRVAVIQDDGLNPKIHPVTSVLHGVHHLGVFLDSAPTTLVGGVVTAVGALIDPLKYLVPLI